MFHPGKTQTNPTFASMQRTFYPKHVLYFGNGTGRDMQILCNNGGLEKLDRTNLCHNGVHLKTQNPSNFSPRQTNRGAPGFKEPPTFTYLSDGSGRDSYILKNNGGSRVDYNCKLNGDSIFRSSLRDGS